MSKNITAPWTSRNGKEYLISLTVVECIGSNPSISLKITDKISAEEWSCNYDSKYIETLTHRTGNFKPCCVFISMIKSALLRKSESVGLDLMTGEDLEGMRDKKSPSSTVISAGGGEGTICKNSLKEMGMGDRMSMTALLPQSQSDDIVKPKNPDISKKKYLIVTYVAEFDRVMYPLPLNYTGGPNSQVMQKNIILLRQEVVALRNSKQALEEELNYLKDQPVIASDNHNHEVDRTSIKDQSNQRPIKSRTPEDGKLIKQLNSKIEYLQAMLLQEKADHQEDIDKLQAENEIFRQKLEAAEEYEEKLEEEIYFLKGGNSIGRQRSQTDLLRLGYNSSPSRRLEKSAPVRTTHSSNFTRLGISPNGVRRSRSFSPSPSRRHVFDPTAYVREKKLKQNRIAELRMNRIQSQLRSRDSSPAASMIGFDLSPRSSPRIRSRSSSQSSIRSFGKVSRTRTVSPSPTRSPHPAAQDKLRSLSRGVSEIYKEIQERLGTGREKSGKGKRSASYKKDKENSPYLGLGPSISSSSSLQAHVDSIIRQETILTREKFRRK